MSPQILRHNHKQAVVCSQVMFKLKCEHCILLSDQDSNLDQENQNLLCCLYTIGQLNSPKRSAKLDIF
jgi:hypothetical protein